MKIEDNSDAEFGSIQYLINLESLLYAFSDNSIYKVLPAESIDPGNLHPETRHSYQKCYSIGCKNSYVARSIIQIKEILDSIILHEDLEKKPILDHAWNCTQLLLNCESTLFKIYSEVMKLMPECDSIIESTKNGTAIPTLPQVEDLNGKVAIFLGNAKRFLERTHEFLSIFYKTPNFKANFKAYREWLIKNNPNNEKIIKILEEDKDRIRLIASLRNAHEMNHSEPQNDLEIANFRVLPGNKFSNPGWKYDLRAQQGPVQSEFSDIVKDMDVFLSNLLTFYEDLILCCIEDRCDKTWKFKVYKKKEEDIKINCPTIYFVSRDCI